MKKKNISGDPKNYITTGEVKEITGLKVIPNTLQKYEMRGSRKTFYLLEDVKKLIPDQNNEAKEKEENKDKIPAPEKLVLEAYVDGSFNQAKGIYGSSVIMVNNDEVIAIKTSNGSVMKAMRNVAGEISAAALAVKLAEELYADELIIRYDYEGIEKWVTGEWKAKNEYTAKYAQFMRKERAFTLKFEHVKAHTGDKYNEMADDMAVRAVGLKPDYDDRNAAPVEGKIPEDVLRVKYQVKTSCLNSIKEFYSKEKRVFKDYLGLKSGTGDNFSRYWSIEDFAGIISPDAISYVEEKLSDNRDILSALRWIARGLDPYDAVKKVNVDIEIYSKKGSR